MSILSERFIPKKKGQQWALETKAAILKAAAKAFADKGFKGCTIRQIAKAADVKHQSLSFHFGSKEDLWIAVVKYLYNEMKERSSVEYDSEKDILIQFKAHLRGTIQYVADCPELIRIIYQESMSNSKRLEKLNPQIEAAQQIALFHLSQLRKLGYLKNIPDIDLVFLYSGAINGRFLQAQLNESKTGKAINHPDIVSAHTEALMKLLTGL